MKKIETEICIDTIESAIIAEKAGADQIEVCQALNAGGLTPSKGFIKTIKKHTSIKTNLMIRPRSGDFYYSDYEKELMLEDIRLGRKLGVDGIVVGGLVPSGEVDKDFMKACIKEAEGLYTTFHRAFDMVKNPEKSLEEIIDLGFDRILTSGGKNSAYDGRENIKSLVKKAGGRIVIMPGAGVNPDNINKLVEYTGVEAIHFSAKEDIDSEMEYRNPSVNMGGSVVIPEYEYAYTNEKKARQMVDALKKEV